MPQTSVKITTLEEFLAQSETKPAQEYIDNQIYTKPMPQGQHSRIQLKLTNAINAVTEDRQIALAFPELRCTFAGKSIVPDVAVFTWDKLPVNEDDTIANKFNITPDWIIEILSPEQYMGLITKKIIGVASLRDDMQLFSIKKKYLLKAITCGALRAIASNLKKVKIVF